MKKQKIYSESCVIGTQPENFKPILFSLNEFYPLHISISIPSF